MKKLVKITSVIAVSLVLAFSMPITFATAVSQTIESPKVKVKNVNKGIKISWKKVDKAKKYIVMRKLSTAKKYKSIKTVKSAKGSVYIDNSAKASKAYTYKVQAVKGRIKADSKAKEIVRLKAPEIWNRTEMAGCIYISAQGQVKGAKEYEVYRAKIKKGKTGKYKKVATFDASDQWAGYRDKTTEKGVFKFKMRAINGNSKSPFSKILKMDYIMPLSVSAALREDNHGIDVTWAKMESVKGFRIYRSANGGEVEVIKEIAIEDCKIYRKTKKDNLEFFYTDRKVKEGITYDYYVEAYTGKKVYAKQKALDPVTYQSADYYVNVGETSPQVAQEIADAQQLLKEMGMEADYTVTLHSDTPYVLQVDENNNLIGVSRGKATLKKTVTMIIDGEESVTEEYFEVIVLRNL